MKGRTLTIVVVALLPLAWAGACAGAHKTSTSGSP